MESRIFVELHERLQVLAGKAGGDPLSRCLADQLRIVLQSLEGWDALHGLIAGTE